MPGFDTVELDSRVLIWGPGDRVVPLLNRIQDKMPICWAYTTAQQVPSWFNGQTIWNTGLLSLQGSYGQFSCQLSNGKELSVGSVVLFPEETISHPAAVPAGETIGLLISGVSRGIFARAMERAIDLAAQHQVYVITDDIQVAFPGGEDLFTRARRQGIIFFRSREWIVTGDANQGYFIDLPAQDVIIEVNQVFTYQQPANKPSEFKQFKLGPMSVSGVLNTRRAGVYVFPRADETAPTEEVLLYDALASRLQLTARGQGVYACSFKIKPETCALCLTCYRVCPHQAITIRFDDKYANIYKAAALINPAACQGCGTCYSSCPARAIQWEAETNAAGQALVCENSGWQGSIAADQQIRQYPCASAISSIDILQAALTGPVSIYGCREGSCRHQGCAPGLEARLQRLQDLLQSLGIILNIKLVRVAAADLGRRIGGDKS